MYLFREFKPVSSQFEFRAFVYDSKLTAVSQYFDQTCYSQCVEHRELIAKLLNEFYLRLKPSLEFDECSLDIAVDIDRQKDCTLIEINPFGKPNGAGTGTALFNNTNESDLKVLFGDAPFECRIVTKPLYADIQSMKLRGPLLDWLIENKFC